MAEIKIKVGNANDYLIPATEAKRFTGLYYIRAEEEYTGNLNHQKELRYTLELCKKKIGDNLVSELWKRTPLHRCWIVKPECRIQDHWTQLPYINTFVSVQTKEDVRKIIEKTILSE